MTTQSSSIQYAYALDGEGRTLALPCAHILTPAQVVRAPDPGNGRVQR